MEGTLPPCLDVFSHHSGNLGGGGAHGFGPGESLSSWGKPVGTLGHLDTKRGCIVETVGLGVVIESVSAEVSLLRTLGREQWGRTWVT